MGELTKQEQKALDDLKKVCATHGPKNPSTALDCAFLKRDQERDNQAKQAEIEAIARNNLTNERVRAVAYVTKRINDLQTQGILLIGALVHASGNYDQILAARAVKPVLFEIAFTLALAALPELKIIGRAARLFMPRSGSRSAPSAMELENMSFEAITTALENAIQPVSKGVARLTTFVQSLDNQAKDLIEAIKDPLAAHKDIDEETQKRFSAHRAKNQILTQILKEIKRTLVTASFVESICHRFIFWYNGQDVLAQVQRGFHLAGLADDIAYKATAFDQFSELLLYDMLRAYVKSSVVVVQPGYYHGDDRIREGLDGAQAKLIYSQFRTVPWMDPSRPPINNVDDLIKHMGANVLQPQSPNIPAHPTGRGRNAW